MKKNLAKKHDQFLAFLTGAFKFQAKIDHKELITAGETMSCSQVETEIILDILVADGLINRNVRSSKMGDDIEYTSNPSLARQIYNNGGYGKIAQERNIERQNQLFTLIRHWIWFLLAIFSLLLNLYLLFIDKSL